MRATPRHGRERYAAQVRVSAPHQLQARPRPSCFPLCSRGVNAMRHHPSSRLASTLTFWSKALEVMRVLGVWKGLSITCARAAARSTAHAAAPDGRE